MIARLQASSTVVKELNANGYSRFFDEKNVIPLIDEIDNDLEKIITKEKSYDKYEMLIKIRSLVSKGIASNLRDELINTMADFVISKLERYITSGFTQSYHTLEKERYFSYCSGQYYPSNEFQEIVNDALIHLRGKVKQTSKFDHLLINFGIDHLISREISQFAKTLIHESTGERKSQ